MWRKKILSAACSMIHLLLSWRVCYHVFSKLFPFPFIRLLLICNVSKVFVYFKVGLVKTI